MVKVELSFPSVMTHLIGPEESAISSEYSRVHQSCSWRSPRFRFEPTLLGNRTAHTNPPEERKIPQGYYQSGNWDHGTYADQP